MKLEVLEPFAVGYMNASGSVSTKIAAGMYNLCKYLPLTIDPEIGLASVDESPKAVIRNIGVVYEYGSGILCRSECLEREMEEYPELKPELEKIRDTFTPLATYGIFFDKLTEHENRLISSNTLWGGTWGGHGNPGYGSLVRLGTNGLRKKIEEYRPLNPESGEWYDSLLTVLDGLDILGERFKALALSLAKTDSENKETYIAIAKAFDTIPQNPAHDFFTACQSFYLAFSFDGQDSPGGFDLYMGDYYGKIDSKADKKIMEGLWIGFHKTRAWNLCIGGSDENWNDLSNALTYDILDIAEKYKFKTPNLTMRCHRNTPEVLLRKAAHTIGSGVCMPALYNDEVVCPALEELGIPPHDSHLYAMNGCNQIDIQGKSHMGLEDGEVCLLKCLELALFDGKCLLSDDTLGVKTGSAVDFNTFDELFNAYKLQVNYAIKKSTYLANTSQEVFSKNAPNPLRSLFIEGCIEKGKDYKSGGPLYNHGQILAEGLADAVDSLMAIKHFVYDTNTYSIEELLDALRNDFENREEMRLKLKNYKKFGNDCEEIDKFAGEVVEHFFKELMKYHTFRDSKNGIFGGGLSTFQRTGQYGGSCGASANGRHAKDGNIADSIGATPGMDKNGPTALIKSVLCYPQNLAKSGFVMQMKFDKKLFNTAKGTEGFLSLLKTYFANGGQQLTVNVLSQEELLDAQKHPEKYSNLIVRVGGYSEYFVNLPKVLQDNVIARSIQAL